MMGQSQTAEGSSLVNSYPSNELDTYKLFDQVSLKKNYSIQFLLTLNTQFFCSGNFEVLRSSEIALKPPVVLLELHSLQKKENRI